MLVTGHAFAQLDEAGVLRMREELGRAGISDTAKVNRYIELCLLYRNTHKDSALANVNRAVKLSAEIKFMEGYAQALYTKATVFYFSGEYRVAKNLQMMSLQQAKKLHNRKLEARNYNLLGAIEFNQGNYTLAEKYYSKKIPINQELKDTSAMIETYYNIALIHQNQGNYRKTIDYNYKALRLAEFMKDKAEVLYCAQGLGMAYHKLKDYANASHYLNRAEQIARAVKDLYALSGILIDQGNVFLEKGAHDSCRIKFNEALALSRKTDDKYHYAISLNAKAQLYLQTGRVDEALKLAAESEKIELQLNRRQGLVICYNLMAECYIKTGEPAQAYKYAHKARSIAKELKSMDELKGTYRLLFLVHEKQHPDSALYYYQKHIYLKDSLNSAEQLRAVANQELDYEKTKLADQNAYQKKLDDARVQKQKQIRNILIGFAALLLLVLFFLFLNFKQKKKANVEINRQHKIIEAKNKDILDSINYSRRIQHAILTPLPVIQKLLPESFVLFKPKDIVSGDFYFIEPIETESTDEWIAVAMADCTGHGVPGAFMSIMGYNFLRQSLKEKSIAGPGEALDYVSRELHAFLRVNQPGAAMRDGMDISFCAFNKTARYLRFAGANNPLWILSRKTGLIDDKGNALNMVAQKDEWMMYEIKADKQHIGFSENSRPFTTHGVALQPGDRVYLFTDGYPDQFGCLPAQQAQGAKAKKLKHKPLVNLILQTRGLSLPEQQQQLEQFFDDWKGDNEQVDDVSIIGFVI